ncbi:MAG TPA: RNA 2'-phosphotransferase, partial [Longimicrobiales bacterium]|nr:RNA 2'-phosphotransferase [Longimicrobiales bacterium]
LDVELELEPTPPPARLFHGTARRRLASIRKSGLEPRGRRFVHLSEDRSSAREVGRRHGEPVVLLIRASSMAGQGHRFYRPASGVWLVARVPAAYLEEPNG